MSKAPDKAAENITEKAPENAAPTVQVSEASFTARVKPAGTGVATDNRSDFAARFTEYKTTHRKENVVFSAAAQGLHGAITLGAIGMLLNSGKQYLFAHGGAVENGEKIFKFSKTSMHKWIKWPALLGVVIGSAMGAIRATNHNNKMDTMQFAEMLEAQRAAQQANDQQPQMSK